MLSCHCSSSVSQERIMYMMKNFGPLVSVGSHGCPLFDLYGFKGKYKLPFYRGGGAAVLVNKTHTLCFFDFHQVLNY